jgi:heme-degrading monooxygenase HmoA
MIARTWRGRANAAQAHLYSEHFSEAVLPRLRALTGFVGASLLRRADGDEVEYIVLTYWDSMEAVARFAGPTPDVAVVDAEARAALISFDEQVLHYDVVAGKTVPVEPVGPTPEAHER